MKSIKIFLSNKFYDKEAISDSISDFKEICEGKILNSDFEIQLIPKTKIDMSLKEEFSNYVLGLMKNKN